MKSKKIGKRHKLLLYKHTLDRQWMPVFPLSLLIFGWLWFSGKDWTNIGYIPALPPQAEMALLFTAIVIILFTIFALIARSMAYVQARQDHLRLASPLLKVKVSYRRIQRVYPAAVDQLFSHPRTPNSLKSILDPYRGETAMAVELKGYPIPKVFLKLFFGGHILKREGEGLFLLVQDWMGLTTEVDSLQSSWKQGRILGKGQSHASYRLLQGLRRK
jgi:hypothetical protein